MENPSEELRNIDAFVAMMRRVLADAVKRLELEATRTSSESVEFPQLDVYSFKQTWPDAACGFGGIAAQVLTDAQTVVVNWSEARMATVYIRGEFAYLVENPNDAFWGAVSEHHLPGAATPHDHLGG